MAVNVVDVSSQQRDRRRQEQTGQPDLQGTSRHPEHPDQDTGDRPGDEPADHAMVDIIGKGMDDRGDAAGQHRRGDIDVADWLHYPASVVHVGGVEECVRRDPDEAPGPWCVAHHPHRGRSPADALPRDGGAGREQ